MMTDMIMTQGRVRCARRVFLTLTLLCASLLQTAAAAAPVVQVRAVKQVYGASDNLTLIVSFQNPTSRALKVLKWKTPLEGDFTADMFDVLRDGKPVKYIGKLVKRGQPTAADFVTIAPGASVSASLDISKGYEIVRKGSYSVRFREPLQTGTTAATSLLKKAASNAVTFFLQQDRARAKAGPASFSKRQPAYSGCSASQRSALDSALTEAENISRVARDALNNTPVSQRPGAQRYKTWFGAYTSSRYVTASSHFNNIYDALANRTISFHCDCNDAYFAYVHSNDPYNIHICSVFWSAPLSGTDSRAGTIVHEMSHFDVVAGTDDHAYGQSDAQSLAVNSPDLALDNADSHEYFAENTPSIPMGVVGDSFEPDNSAGQARVISPGAGQTHSINPVGDSDWVKFTLGATSNIVLQTSGGSGDTRLWLYDSGLGQIGFDDDGGSGYFSRIVKNGLAPGTYYARIDEYGNNAVIASYSIALTVASVPPPPPAPSASDLAVQYAGSVHIAWPAVAGASSYRVYRCTTTATSTCVQLAAPTATVYTDNDAQAGTVYYYRVRACNSVGCSGYSAPNAGSARPRVNIVPILELLLFD